jgi:tRNA (guanine37-N1)-methyltransferase
MNISVLTLFPEVVEMILESSILGRARRSGVYALETIQIRDYAINDYGKVDDTCYGGGPGMLMMAEPIYRAWEAALDNNDKNDNHDNDQVKRTRTIHLSPRGSRFNQADAMRLAAGYDHLIFICGHYEGIDQRVIDEIVDEEYSIGDYVLTGGELPACVMIDAILRHVEGVLPKEESYMDESHMNGLLEYPQYTRPPVWHDRTVPDVLLSGHQANIENWRLMHALRDTLDRRPDLLKTKLDAHTWEGLIQTVLAEKTTQEEKKGETTD